MENLRGIVAQRLKSLLRSNNLSQKQFAEKASLSKDTVSKLLNENMTLSVPNAIRISQAFGVSLDYLYGRSEEENRNQYALEILLKHFCAIKEKSYWGTSSIEVHISISPELGALLETITDLMEARIDDDLRREGIHRAKAAFLQVIDNPHEKPKKYVLFDPDLYTDEVRDAIKKAKENRRGQRQD